MNATQRLLADRRARVVREMTQGEVDVLLVNDPLLAWWISGSRTATSVWITKDGDLLDSPKFELVRALHPSVIGLAGSFPSALVAEISAVGSTELRDLHTSLIRARRGKDLFEIEMLSRAARMTEAALRRHAARPFRSESAFIDAVLDDIHEQGGDGYAYDPSVASGAATARVWTAPSRKLVFGHTAPIVIDAAAQVRGYKADCTVSLVGSHSKFGADDVTRLGDVIDATVDDIQGGVVLASELARRAEMRLSRAGYAPPPHAYGHGIGLELHEEPYITLTSRHELQPGDVFMLEPAAYIPGTGGLRIESMFRIDEAGAIQRILDAHALSEDLSRQWKGNG